VTRRLDNNMINGTKLLNITRMTRGRRDGILKNEKRRKVIRIGAMPLKGVWIPFERAVALAKIEGVFHLLLPLFADDP
ncbi:apses-domain-containing protein, partial [Ramicandelaber brevisporus]